MKQKTALAQNKKKTYMGYLIKILSVALLIAGVLFLLDQRLWEGSVNPQYNGNLEYAEPSWVYSKGGDVLDPELTVPAFRHMEKGVVYSISTVLTYDGSNDRSPTIFFFVDHMFCRVLLDGETVFSYLPSDFSKPDRSKSPGNVYVSAELPNDCKGKLLTVEFVPSLDADIEYQLPNPTFGDYGTQMADNFWEELPHNIIVTLTLFLGIGCIFYSAIAMSGDKCREGIFIGIFSILFGIYNLTESDFDFYMISNPYYTYVLDYITFTLAPIFFLAFLRERMSPMQKKISLAMIIADAVMFAVEMALHFTGVWDMREFLPILHAVYFINFVVHLVLLATSGNIRWKKSLLFQLIPIFCGMFIDVMVYYMHWQLNSGDSTFTGIGIIVFMISELFHVWKYSIEVYTESTRSRLYQQLAYVDSLTGIGNRRAFELEKEALESGQKPFDSVTVVSADLNNLKVTNDRLGHASGDFLIRSVANVLTDLAQGYGEVFRVGGDEFVGFLYGINREQIEEKLRMMDKHIEEINSNSNAKLDLAVGVAVSRGDVETALADADRNMYIDKENRKTALKKAAQNGASDQQPKQ